MPTVEEEVFETIPEGEFFNAQLNELKHKTVKWTDKQTLEEKSWDKLEWWFVITDGAYKGRKVKGETDARISTHPNNQYRLWVEALFDMEVTAGFHFEEEDLLGLRCRISVVHTPDRKDPNRVWENVSAVDRVLEVDSVPF